MMDAKNSWIKHSHFAKYLQTTVPGNVTITGLEASKCDGGRTYMVLSFSNTVSVGLSSYTIARIFPFRSDSDLRHNTGFLLRNAEKNVAIQS